eukprot:639154-Rhodomonas_salina.2
MWCDAEHPMRTCRELQHTGRRSHGPTLRWGGVGWQVLFIVELTLRMMGSNSLPEFFSRGHDKFDFFVFLLTAMVGATPELLNPKPDILDPKP